MNLIKSLLLTPLALLMLAGVGYSQTVGNIGAITIGTDGSFTSDSLTLPTTMYISSSSGTLSSEVNLSEVTLDGSTIGGLSSTPLAVSVPDYISFSTAGLAATTGDNNRYTFDLSSLAETNYFSQDLGADFTAAGTLTDSTTGSIADANVYISFSGANSPIFSLGVDAAPEPSTWALFGLGAVALLVRVARRRATV